MICVMDCTFTVQKHMIALEPEKESMVFLQHGQALTVAPLTRLTDTYLDTVDKKK